MKPGEHIGRRDGRVEVACYCGRHVEAMTWSDLWSGHAPTCTTDECRSEERRRERNG